MGDEGTLYEVWFDRGIKDDGYHGDQFFVRMTERQMQEVDSWLRDLGDKIYDFYISTVSPLSFGDLQVNMNELFQKDL